jgi:hypothetical protein
MDVNVIVVRIIVENGVMKAVAIVVMMIVEIVVMRQFV